VFIRVNESVHYAGKILTLLCFCDGISEKGDDKLSSLIKRQAELDAQLNEELQAHSAMKTRVENLQLEIDDLKAGEAASR
jgi:hypothetical protein